MKKYINPLSAAIYVVCNALVLFVVYKRLAMDLGIELFGIWSMILTFNVSFPLFFTGFFGSIAKYLPEYLLVEDYARIKKLTSTSLTTVFFFSLTLLLSLYWVLPFFLDHLVHSKYVSIIEDSLGASLCYVFASVCTMAFLAVLEGYNKVYIKNCILLIQSVSLLAFILSTEGKISYSETATVFAISSIISLVLSFVALGIFTFHKPWYLLGWHKSVLKETSVYHVQYFTSNLFGLLLEPLNKIIIIMFAGASAVALYEMATKFVMQARSVLVSVILSLVPFFARKSKSEPDLLQEYYILLFRINGLLSIFTFSSLALILPSLSLYWLGELDFSFILMATILIVGWFINNLCLPAYMINAAASGISLNTRTSLEILMIDLGVGILLGFCHAEELVVLAWLIALVHGGLKLISKYNQRNKISLAQLIKPRDMWLAPLLPLSLLFPFLFFLVACPFGIIATLFISVSSIMLLMGLQFLISKREIVEVMYRVRFGLNKSV